MNLRQLEVFRAVMRCRTVTDAATMLNVSQPAVTRILQHLESQLGFQLFHRVRGRLYPTENAEKLYPESERIFRSVNGLNVLANNLRMGNLDVLRVGATSSLGMSIVPDAIVGFSRENPGIRVSSSVLPAGDIAELMISRQLDVALTLSPISAPSVETAITESAELVCLMNTDHQLSSSNVITGEELSKLEFVTYSVGTHFRDIIEDSLSQGEYSPDIRIEVASSLAAMPIVQRGAVALVDSFAIPIQWPHLTWRPFRPRIPVYVHLAVREDRRELQHVRRFLKHIGDATAAATAEFEAEKAQYSMDVN